MGTYRIGADGHLTEYQVKRLGDEHCEEEFKDWLEQNPQMLIDKERVLWIGREVTTELGKLVDLLGLDKRGQILAVEVKAGTSPRSVIAQALEYGVWADSLAYEDLSRIARDYWRRKSEDLDWIPAGSEHDIPDLSEGFEVYFDEEREIPARQTVIYVVAQRMAEDIQRVAHWLRKHGIDVRCLEFTYHEGEKKADHLLTTTLTVGQVSLPESGRGPIDRETFLQRFEEDADRGAVERLIDALERIADEHRELCTAGYRTANWVFEVHPPGEKAAGVFYIGEEQVSPRFDYMRRREVPPEIWQGYRDRLYDYDDAAPWEPSPQGEEEPELHGFRLPCREDLLTAEHKNIVSAVEWLVEQLAALE